MKVSLWLSPVVSAAVLFGSVGVATVSGDWVTGGREQVARSTRLTVDDIRGWMSLGQVADGLGVPAALLVELIAPPPSVDLPASLLFKDVEARVPGFELASFRDRLRGRLASGSPGLPAPAASGSRR